MSLFVLKAKKYSKTSAGSSQIQQCSICKLNLDEQTEIYSLPCGHLFHESCLQMHLAKKTFCPVCKLSITQSNDDLFGSGSRNHQNLLSLAPPSRRSHTRPQPDIENKNSDIFKKFK